MAITVMHLKHLLKMVDYPHLSFSVVGEPEQDESVE